MEDLISALDSPHEKGFAKLDKSAQKSNQYFKITCTLLHSSGRKCQENSFATKISFQNEVSERGVYADQLTMGQVH